MARPALLPALALLAGAGAGWSFPVPSLAIALGLAVLTVSAAVLGVVLGARRSAAAACLLGFALTGLVAGQRSRAELPAPILEWFEAEVAADAPDAVTWIVGRLRRDAAPTDYGASLTVEAIRVEQRMAARPLRGVVRASVGGSLVDGRIDAWRQGRTVRLPVRLRRPARYANHGTRDQAQRLRVRGVDLLGSVTSALQVEVLAEGSLRQEWGGRARAFVRRSVAATVGTHGARSAAIVTAVLIGDRAGLDRDTTERLQQGGVYHVIAISGGNIAVLTAALLLVLRVAGAGGRLAALLVILCLLAYAHVVAPEASVTRAVFAAVVFLAARAVDHRTDPLNTLALSAGCLVAADPRSLVDAGFQLTFGGHGRTPGGGAAADGVGRRQRGAARGGPAAAGSRRRLAAGDDLCGTRAVPDRRAPFLAGHGRRPGPQLRRHTADVRHPVGRHGGGRPAAAERRRGRGGGLDRARRRGRHRRVDAPPDLGALAVVAAAPRPVRSPCSPTTPAG